MRTIPALLWLMSLTQAAAIVWPEGQYCLPMATNQHCPFGWDRGYRFHATEGSNSVRGDVPYLATRGKDFGWGVCCKSRVRYSRVAAWPKGSYCILRKGGFCPRGFMEGTWLCFFCV